MKTITIAGKLGADAELKYIQSGDPVLRFSIAVDDRSAKEKATIWFDCSMWGKRGEKLAQYLTKGSAVTVSGDFSVRKWQKDGQERTGFGVRVNDVTLQGGRQNGGGSSRTDTPSNDAGGGDFGDDDVPFAPRRGPL